jgi:hypothetical protein
MATSRWQRLQGQRSGRGQQATRAGRALHRRPPSATTTMTCNYQQSANNGGGRRRGACDDNDDDNHNDLIGIEDVNNTCPAHQPNTTISHMKGGRKRWQQRGRLRRVLEDDCGVATGGGDNDNMNMTTTRTTIRPPCPSWRNRLWLLWPGAAMPSALANDGAIGGGKALGGKNSNQQSSNNGGEGDDGNGRQLCERRGMEEAIASPPLLPAAVTAMPNNPSFVGGVDGKFGGGDGRGLGNDRKAEPTVKFQCCENLSSMPVRRKTNAMVPRGVRGGIGAVFFVGIFQACVGNISINTPI